MFFSNCYYGTGETLLSFLIFALAIIGMLMVCFSLIVLMAIYFANWRYGIKTSISEWDLSDIVPFIIAILGVILLIVSLYFGNNESSKTKKRSDENIITDITNKFADDNVDIIPNADNKYDRGNIHTSSNGNWSYIVDYEKDTITLYPDDANKSMKIIVR